MRLGLRLWGLEIGPGLKLRRWVLWRRAACEALHVRRCM